jgi:outer membrane protein TolC
VTDWGRTHASLKRSLLDVEGRTLELESIRSDIVFEVTRLYFQLLKAGKDLDVAEETLALNDERLEQAEAFFRVGRVSRYDVTASQVSRSHANLALIQARTSRKEAMTSLKAAMGFTDAPEFSIAGFEDDPGDLSQEDLPALERAIEFALGNRPDLLSYKVSLESAENSVTLARLDNAPQLHLSGSYGWGSSGFWGQDTWRTGITLSFPLYDGGLQREKTREAKANLDGAQARLEAYRQRVVSDVTSAWLAASDSTETVAAAAEGLRMALENLEIATGRYQVGVGSPLEVSDATRNYTEAKAAWHSALYDGMTARAALEKAMGVTGR